MRCDFNSDCASGECGRPCDPDADFCFEGDYGGDICYPRP
jgi:hypothetical protein